jgi:uncharacterized protein YprB with RNaseH-like and TPR domain
MPSRTLERLRQIVKAGPSRVPVVRELTYEPLGADGQPFAEPPRESPPFPGATDIETPFGVASVVERSYDPAAYHGGVRIGSAALFAPDTLQTLSGRAIDVPRGATRSPLFFDLETTGLHGGAGTIAFLVGMGFFDEAGAFQTRQFFLRGFGNERAMLHAVAAHIEGIPLVVTYNGGSFDLPLMETRWLFHRMPPAFDGRPHFDMLVTARRLWKAAQDEDARSCRLVALEDILIGNRRVGDVPGFEIPQRYFDFVRSGDPEPLEPVLEHNRLDLLSTAVLFGRAQQLVQQGPAGASDAYECLSLARLHERAGASILADEAYRATLGHPLADRAARERAWHGLAVLLRRRRRFEEAAAAWRELLLVVDRRSRVASEAIEALAIHHEHRARNLRTAHALAQKALSRERDPRKREALEHRLARLDRKLVQSRDDETLTSTVSTPLPWDE